MAARRNRRSQGVSEKMCASELTALERMSLALGEVSFEVESDRVIDRRNADLDERIAFYAEVIARILAGQIGLLLAAMEDNKDKLTEAAMTPGFESRVSVLMDSVEWETQSLLASVIGDARAEATTMGRAHASSYGVGVFMGKPNPRASAAAQASAAELVTRVNRTTRKGLRDLTAHAIAQGWSYEELSGAIKDKWAGGPEEEYRFGAPRPQQHIRDRAMLVAVTEMGNAYSEGNAELGDLMYAEGLPIMKRWIAKGDERMCPICGTNADASWIGWTEEFPSGHTRPLAHPACRCGMTDRVWDEDMGVPVPSGFESWADDSFYDPFFDEEPLLLRNDDEATGWFRSQNMGIRVLGSDNVDSRSVTRSCRHVRRLWRDYGLRVKEVVYRALPRSTLAKVELGQRLVLNTNAYRNGPVTVDDMVVAGRKTGWFAQFYSSGEDFITDAWAHGLVEAARANPVAITEEALAVGKVFLGEVAPSHALLKQPKWMMPQWLSMYGVVADAEATVSDVFGDHEHDIDDRVASYFVWLDPKNPTLYSLESATISPKAKDFHRYAMSFITSFLSPKFHKGLKLAGMWPGM